MTEVLGEDAAAAPTPSTDDLALLLQEYRAGKANPAVHGERTGTGRPTGHLPEGAPDALLAHVDPVVAAQETAVLDRFAADGLRVLAVAERHVPPAEPSGPSRTRQSGRGAVGRS
jgi:hypothetical protein